MIIANLATYPPRRHNLEKVVAVIAPQVDRLNIILNQYDSIPMELEKYSNVISCIPKEDLKDTGKFYPKVNDAQYVFLIDDDIIYSPDYISMTVARFESLGLYNCMAGYHGSLYLEPSLRQYLWSPGLFFTYKNKIANYRHGKMFFYNELKMPMVVDQIGSGTAILRGKDFPSFEYMRSSQKYVDVRLARWCFERGIAPVCLARTAHWLQAVSFDETVYDSFTEKNPSHVNSEILTYAFKVRFRGMAVTEILRNQTAV